MGTVVLEEGHQRDLNTHVIPRLTAPRPVNHPHNPMPVHIVASCLQFFDDCKVERSRRQGTENTDMGRRDRTLSFPPLLALFRFF